MGRIVPEISIIMATFNRAHIIEKTLESIVNQSFENWECIIVDDRSVDNTLTIIKEFGKDDPRINFNIRSDNYKKGISGCRNQGLDLAKGKFVIFFDDDDIIHPQNLQTCVQLLRKKKYAFCRYDKQPFWGEIEELEFKPNPNPKKKPFIIDDLDKMITGEISFASCCVMWRKYCFAQDRFNENLVYAEELECYSRILSKGLEGINLNEVLYYNRKHPNSNTGEFQRRDPIRVKSQIQAAILVIENLASKGLFNEKLKVYFWRMGFELNSLVVVKKSLEASGSGKIEKWKYQIAFKFYPLLKPIFYLKSKIFKN